MLCTAFPPCPGGRQGREAEAVGEGGPGQETESHAGLPHQLPRRRSAAHAGQQSSKMSSSSDSHETCSTCDGCLTRDHARSVNSETYDRSLSATCHNFSETPCRRPGWPPGAWMPLPTRRNARTSQASAAATGGSSTGSPPPRERGVACARRQHPDRLPRHVVVRAVGPSAQRQGAGEQR